MVAAAKLARVARWRASMWRAREEETSTRRNPAMREDASAIYDPVGKDGRT